MWEQATEASHLKGLKIFTEELKRFNVPVYSVLGNHEGYPYDQFDTENPKTHNWIINNATEAWKQWFTEDMIKTFKRNGCYSTIIKETKLKVIALTPFTMMNDNRYLWGNQTDPLGVVN